MEKKKIAINILLCIVLVVLVVLIVFLYDRNKKIWEKKAAENVTLTEISYGSEIVQIGYAEADGLLDAFVNAYNDHNGEAIIQIMDLVSAFIYEEVESDINKFDDKYVEILSNPSEYEDLILMQYSLKNQEKSLIDAISATNVTLSIEDYSEIEDVTKYLSKMTAQIRTISAEEGINQVDTLEFLLINKNNSYNILNYYVIDENEDKIEENE